MKSFRRPSRILLVESDLELLAEMAEVLRCGGYTCRCAGDASSAQQVAGRFQPDLLIAAADLADADGAELCQAIRNQQDAPGMPVVLLVDSPYSYAEMCADDPDARLLRKPFDPVVLLELVDHSMWMPHLAAEALCS